MKDLDCKLAAAYLLIDLRKDGDSLELAIWPRKRKNRRWIPMAFSELNIAFLVDSD